MTEDRDKSGDEYQESDSSGGSGVGPDWSPGLDDSDADNNRLASGSGSRVQSIGNSLRNTENLRERAVAGLITAFIIAGLVISGSPAGAVSTSLSTPSDNVNLFTNDDVTLTYDIEIESGERIQIDGYEFDITDEDGDTTTVEADGFTPRDGDLSVGTDNSDAIDISANDLSINTDVSGVESQFGYGDLSGYDNAAGYDAFAGYGYGYSSSGDNKITVELTINGAAFETVDYDAVARTITDSSGSTAFADNSVTFTVEDTVVDDDDDEEEPEEEEEEDDSGQGGAGGQPGGEEDQQEDDQQEDDQQEDQTPTVEEAREVLDQTEPSTETTTEISDADPDTPGVNVRPEETESVEEITINNEEASGTIDIREWQDPPEEVAQSVAGAVQDNEEVTEEVADEVDADTETEITAQVTTVADIDPSSEEVEGSSATVTMTASPEELEDPQDAVIVHETEDSWEVVETTVEERGEEEIALEGDVESFSLFAVAEIETTQTGSTDEEQTDSDDGETTDDGDDGGSQTGLIIVGLIALVAVAGAAIYARNNDML